MNLDVFKTGINAVLFLPVFQAVVLVFFTAQWLLRHTGSSGFARVFDYDLYWRPRKLACFACLFHHPRSHFIGGGTGGASWAYTGHIVNSGRSRLHSCACLMALDSRITFLKITLL